MKLKANSFWASLTIALFCSLPLQGAFGAGIELDGNAASDASDDWENIANGTSSAFAILNGDQGGIKYDTFNPANADTVLTGGQTKDDKDLSSWKYKTAKPTPDKNNITNAYAAAYEENEQLIVYFGADRFANEGDAQMGFWFFQNNVSISGGKFNGVHSKGDLLVLANFSGNGDVSVEVYEWNPDDPNEGNNNLRLIASGSDCQGPGATLDTCAITNSGGQTAFWPYTPKSGANGIFPERSFFEGRINLTALNTSGCFSSFLAETRSSTSTDAVLKDFVVGGFNLCAIDASANCGDSRLLTASDTPPGPSPDGDAWLFVNEVTVTVFNSGALALPVGTQIDIIVSTLEAFDIVYVDDNSLTLTSPMPPGPADSVSFDVLIYSDQYPPGYDAEASATLPGPDGAVLVPDDVIIASCFAPPLSPNLDVSKNCETALTDASGEVVVEVNFDVQVCNTGDVPLNVDVSDPIANLAYSIDLDVGMSCQTNSECDSSEGAGDGICTGDAENSGFCQNGTGVVNDGPICHTQTGTYAPSSVNSTVPGEAEFSNTVTATGSHRALDTDPTDMATATCPLCVCEEGDC